MPEESFTVLHALAIEAPRELFWVRFHHRAHRPDGWPWIVPARDALAAVLAETPAGALAIARYHHGLLGSRFRLERRPVLTCDRAAHRVVFADPLTSRRRNGHAPAAPSCAP
jgi:hypothetical protein